MRVESNSGFNFKPSLLDKILGATIFYGLPPSSLMAEGRKLSGLAKKIKSNEITDPSKVKEIKGQMDSWWQAIRSTL